MGGLFAVELIWEDIEDEFERFIAYGAVLDRKTRMYLVAYLQGLLIPSKPVPEALNEAYLNAFSEALDSIFKHDPLIELCKDRELLAGKIIVDTLNWFRKTYRKIERKHPFEDEQREFESWGIRHMRQFVKTWPFLLQKAGSNYTKDELDTSFYQSKFKQLTSGQAYETMTPERLEQIGFVWDDVLRKWDALLQAKILDFQLNQLQSEKENYRDTLHEKVQEFERLSNVIQPFASYAGRYWDMSRELWDQTSFDLLEEYNELLKDEASVKKLADILGKMRQAEIETDEETYDRIVVRGKYVADPSLRSEVVGVEEGDDLNRLITSEIANIADEDTEWLFLKRFADKQLTIHQYEDKHLVESNEVLSERRERIKKKEKGPFIICVDTSGSMEGIPEAIAKVLCFALTKMASETDRKAYLINFSSGIQTINLKHLGQSIDSIAQFLKMSFHGGTDISLALGEALNQLYEHDYQEADVLVISDFIMYELSKDVEERMKFQQVNRGTQFYSLIITEQANEEIIDVFDRVWQYNPDEKGIIEAIYRNVRGVAKRKI